MRNSVIFKLRTGGATTPLRILALFSLILLIRHHVRPRRESFSSTIPLRDSTHTVLPKTTSITSTIASSESRSTNTLSKSSSSSVTSSSRVRSDSTRTSLTARTSSTGNKASPSRPPTVLATALHGGIGNQLYCLIEGIALARRSHVTLIIPSIAARQLSNLANRPPVAYAGHLFWDASTLSRAVPLAPSLPPACHGRFHRFYQVSRSSSPPKHPLSVHTISSRARHEVCFHVGGRHEDETVHECAARGLRGVSFHSRSLPLRHHPDDSFVRELAGLRRDNSAQAPGSRLHGPAANEPVCVFVDGHSFDRAGPFPQEYLYSFLHYVEPARVIRDHATQVLKVGKASLNKLAVLHLRYDERECFGKHAQGKNDRVCLRVRLEVGRADTVYWAGVGEFAGAVSRLMKREGVEGLYLAASPYAPENIVDGLKTALGKSVRLVPTASEDLDHDVQNFVERELAVGAKLFIGDYGSTWSGTVYYKRRTKGKVTHWGGDLLDKIEGDAYSHTARMHPPEWYEQKEVQLAPVSMER